ncbi:MAG TPA: septum formation initiator family protein [Nevskiaceae bacterium]|nr:septum formation initiator family protein [Nevskiaceae bacterium]
MVQKRIVIAVLGVLLAALQWRLWISDDGISARAQLRQTVALARAENGQRAARNAELDAEVRDLNSGQAAIEARARTSMGMIKENETFFLVVQ